MIGKHSFATPARAFWAGVAVLGEQGGYRLVELSASPLSTDIKHERHVGKVPTAEIADASRSEKICSSSNCGLDFGC